MIHCHILTSAFTWVQVACSEKHPFFPEILPLNLRIRKCQINLCCMTFYKIMASNLKWHCHETHSGVGWNYLRLKETKETWQASMTLDPWLELCPKSFILKKETSNKEHIYLNNIKHGLCFMQYCFTVMVCGCTGRCPWS